MMRRNPRYALCVSGCVFLFLIAACGPNTLPTPFIPPTSKQAAPTAAINIILATSAPHNDQPPKATLTPEPSHTAEPPTSTPTCIDSLKFLYDISIPDGTIIQPGQPIEKQWRVANDGSCDWDGRYRLKLIEGDPLGVQSEVAIFPARAGTEATIDITFTAPPAEGSYLSAWQAYNPDGAPFGDPIYLQIIVQP